MTIHTFGAYFGLALSWIISRGPVNEEGKSVTHPKKTTSTTSDLFSMVGTVFLWIFWPSFNAALAVQQQQHRVVLNTVLALCSSCFFAFVIDILLRSA